MVHHRSRRCGPTSRGQRFSTSSSLECGENTRTDQSIPDSHAGGEPRASGGDDLPVLRLHQLPLGFEPAESRASLSSVAVMTPFS
jgi:hypothetical protein